MPVFCIQKSHGEDGEKAGQDRVGYVSAIAAMLWTRNEPLYLKSRKVCLRRSFRSVNAKAAISRSSMVARK